MATNQTQSGAIKALQKELLELNAQPVEGFKVNVSNVEDMFVWDVSIFGPPMTLYEGGYFKARISFPPDYPYSPPSIRFLTKMFHPNIYEHGEVCISILHSPGDDPHSGELAAERWNPTQNVRTILLSVISLLNEPNISSPAHVEASVNYRKWIESGGKDNEYEQIVRALVQMTHEDAEKDGVQVPTTLKDYCFSGRPGDDKDLSDFDDDCGYCPSDVDDDDDDDWGGDLDVNDDAGTPGEVVSSPRRNSNNRSKPRVDAGGTDSALEEVETEPRVKQQQQQQQAQCDKQKGQSSNSS